MAKQKDQRKVAWGLARGLSKAEALRQAGYAESTIDHKSSQIIRRPRIQSFLTEALERMGVTAEKMLKPVVDGLQANVIVKHAESLAAVVTDVPDLTLRMQAHDRIVDLYGGKPRELDTKLAPPLSELETTATSILIAMLADHQRRRAAREVTHAHDA